MVISQPPGNNPSYYYRASSTLHQFLNASRHIYFYTAWIQHQTTHKMVLLSIFFTRIRSTEGSSADCSLFILSLHALALHLAVKYYFVFLYRIWARWPYIHLSVVFPSRMPAGPHFVTQPMLLSENIPNIWHKSSTKHKEVDQIETIKTIMQTTRPRITWKVCIMAQVAIFKRNIQVRKI